MAENTALEPIGTCCELPTPGQVAAFLSDFTANPVRAVETLQDAMTTRTMLLEIAAAILLPYLVKASYAQQNLIAGALERIATPEQVLNAALALHEQTGDPRLLATADQLLANRGAASWPALKSICALTIPVWQPFVSTIATLEGIYRRERRDALALLARNANLDTRWEIVALLDGDTFADPLPVWQVLVNDSNETIASHAAACVASGVG